MIDISTFSIQDASSIISPLVVYAIGMVIYSVFIFKFYKFLGSRDIFNMNLNQYNRFDSDNTVWIKNLFKIALYFIEYIILFPFFVFFWFSIIAILIIFLSKSQSIENILLLSMSLVTAVRITSYYNPDLSKDLAKLLPFSLLGVFLVDTSIFNFESSIILLYEIDSMFITLLYYLIFVIFLELTLRILYSIWSLFIPNEKETDE